MKREKRVRRGIESLKKQIDEHFEKLVKDVEEGDEILARYHIKEIDKSLIDALIQRMELLGERDEELIERYRRRLGEIEARLGE